MLIPRALLVQLLLIITSVAATASEYSYPLELRLGSNINSSAPTEPYPYCFNFKKRRVEGSGSETKLKAKIIHDRRELLKELNISASASARNAFFSGNASSSLDDQYSFSSDSITWIVSLFANYGDEEIVDESIKNEYKPLLENSSEFLTRCGDEIVSVATRTATVAAIFTSHNVSVSSQREQKFAMDVQASGSTGWSGGASASYRNFVKEVSANGQISMDVVLVGGDGTRNISALIKDFGDLKEVSEVLANQVESLNFDSAKATAFKTTSMKRYGWKGQQLSVSRIDVSLEDYYLLYNDTKALKQRSYELISANSSRQIKLTDSQREAVTNLNKSADKLILDLINAADACRKNQDACVPSTDFQLPIAKWPKIDPVGRVTITGNEVKCNAESVVVIPGVKYFCDQTATLTVIGKWADIVDVHAQDSDGANYPVAIGPVSDLAKLYSTAFSASNQTLSEAEFCDLAIGEPCESVDAASKGGWSGRVVTIESRFGSSSDVSQGLRKPINLRFRTQADNAVIREIFLF